MIGLTGDIYEKDKPFNDRRQYVVVRMQIFGENVDIEQIHDFVKNGLRARVKSMGITGVNYVEFDFLPKSASENPVLPIQFWGASLRLPIKTNSISSCAN